MSTTALSFGAWRDRTNLYASLRLAFCSQCDTADTASQLHLLPPILHTPSGRPQPTGSSNDPYSESAGLLGAGAGDGDAIIEMDLLPPRWLDIQDDITSRLTDVSATMKKLDQLHAKHILPGFDDESVKAREEREIEDLTLEVTRGFASCQSAIKRIDKLVQEQAKTQEHRGGLTKEDETMARNLKISRQSR